MNWSELRESLLGATPKSVVPPSVKLPILPLAITKFAERADDPEASPGELARLIESDTGLTCELLRYVNSSARGLTHRASSAPQAVTLLGIRECKLYLLTKAVQRAMKNRESKLVNLRDFWAGNLERALLARETAKLLGADPETAFAAGMLQDFLLPAVTNDLFAKYVEFTQLAREEPTSLVQFEQKTFGWDHAEAAALVMHGWGFPDELICCVRLHHHGVKLLKDEKLKQTAAAAVAVSAFTPDPLQQTPGGMELLKRLGSAWPAFDLLALAEKVDRDFQELSPGGAYPFSLLKRVRKALTAST